MGLLGAAAGYCFCRLAAAGDRRPLGRAGDADRPGPLPAGRRRRLAGAALRHRSAASPRPPGRCSSGSSSTAPRDEPEAAGDGRRGRRGAALQPHPRSESARHALRFGAALAAGVAVYRLLGMDEHGFWIPLTILFVMRPERDETYHRLVLRAVGTVLGLVLATALAEALRRRRPRRRVVLTVAAALTFGLLTVQYALFTAAITTYVVLLTDTLGEAAFDAAGQRAIGTALGHPDRLPRLRALARPGRRPNRGARRRQPVDSWPGSQTPRRDGDREEQTLSNRTFVIGVGMTKFEKPGTKEGDYPDWAKEAGEKALADAGIPYDGRRAGLRRLLLRRLDLRPAGALPARPDRDPGRQRQQQLLDRLLGAVPGPPGGQGRPRRLRPGARLREDGAGQPRRQVHRPHQRARQARDADVRDPRPGGLAAGAADVRQRRPRPHAEVRLRTPTTTPGSAGRTTSTRSTTPTPSSRTSTRWRTSRRRR